MLGEELRFVPRRARWQAESRVSRSCAALLLSAVGGLVFACGENGGDADSDGPTSSTSSTAAMSATDTGGSSATDASTTVGTSASTETASGGASATLTDGSATGGTAGTSSAGGVGAAGGAGGAGIDGGAGAPGSVEGFACLNLECVVGEICVRCHIPEDPVAMVCAPHAEDDPSGFAAATSHCDPGEPWTECDGAEDCEPGEYCSMAPIGGAAPNRKYFLGQCDSVPLDCNGNGGCTLCNDVSDCPEGWQCSERIDVWEFSDGMGCTAQ